MEFLRASDIGLGNDCKKRLAIQNGHQHKSNFESRAYRLG
jgi:hypothetical protein